MTNNAKPTVLLIASVGSGASARNVIGGNRLLAQESVRELERLGFEFATVDASGDVTNLPAWRVAASKAWRFLRVLTQAAQRIGRCRIVMLLVSPPALPVMGTAFWALCAIARRPLVLRVSGGGLADSRTARGPLARAWANHTYMRCPLLYVETRQVYARLQHRANVRWLPNTRNLPVPPRRPEALRRIVFLGRLRRDKGLPEALDACRRLPDTVRLRVYGPVTSSTDLRRFQGHPRASYEGVLKPEDVPGVLAEHDLLLYPSHYHNEGYPGAVLEAFQCGLPVVAHRWGGIGELVEDGKSGLLVARSTTAIRDGIDRLLQDPALYRRLCEGARARGDEFRSHRWYGRMAADFLDLLPRPSVRGRDKL